MVKRFLKVYFVLAVIGIIVSYELPSIPIKACDYDTNKEAGLRYVDCPAYDMGYNIFGVLIYLNRSRTYRTFTDDYSDSLEYLYRKHDFPIFNFENKTLSYYDEYSAQVFQGEYNSLVYHGDIPPTGHIEEDEEAIGKLLDVSTYAFMCLNGTWTGTKFFCENAEKVEKILIVFNIIAALGWIILFAVYCRKNNINKNNA